MMDSPLSEVPATPVLIRQSFLGGEFSPSDAVVPDCSVNSSKDRYGSDSVPGTPDTPFRAPRSRTPSLRDRRHPLQDKLYNITPYRLARTSVYSPYVSSPSDSLVPTTPKSRTAHLTPRGGGPPRSASSPLSTESPGISNTKYISCTESLEYVPEHYDHKSGSDRCLDRNDRNEMEPNQYRDSTSNDCGLVNRRKIRSSNIRRSPRLFQETNDPSRSPDLLDMI